MTVCRSERLCDLRSSLENVLQPTQIEAKSPSEEKRHERVGYLPQVQAAQTRISIQDPAKQRASVQRLEQVAPASDNRAFQADRGASVWLVLRDLENGLDPSPEEPIYGANS